MATKKIVLSDVTAHVHDPDRSIPFEYSIDGNPIKGFVAAKAVPPGTIFELDGDEADTILARHNGVEIPGSAGDPEAWLDKHLRDRGIDPSRWNRR